MLTFLQLKESSIVDIAGVTPSSPQFRTLANDVIRQLMRRGDWPGAIQPMYLCLKRGCVVWPREVGSIRRMNFCNQAVPVMNDWYSYLPWDGQRWNYSSPSWFGTTYWPMCGQRALVTGGFRSPVFQDLLGDGRELRAYIETPLDVGKKLTIFGTDNGNQPLTQKGLGSWNAGAEMTLQNPYTTLKVSGSNVLVRNISRVVKEVTNGRVRLYAFNTATSILEEVATYEPSEVNPFFLRQNVNTSCCSGSEGVLALVKLQFIPVVSDTDYVPIDNLDALKFGFQAVKSRDAGDRKAGDELEGMAIRELNLEVQDQNTDQSVPISFGEAPNGMGVQMCF